MKKLIATSYAFVLLVVSCLPVHASAIGEIELRPSSKATYMATCAPVARAASATDMMRFPGSASKTIKVLKIFVNYSTAGSSAATNHFYLVKRSTAGSGGTSTTTAGVPLDSTNAAASSAGLIDYTANPTVGTLVGTLAIETAVPLNTPAGGSLQFAIFDAAIAGQAIVLRGTAENVCVNNNGVTLAGTTPVCGFTVVWTEE